MKYTNLYFLRAPVLLLLLAPHLCAQSSYYPNAGNLPEPATAFVASAPDAPTSADSDDSVLTIKKRVNEVNVLFIATDKHGKFVRNLSASDFTILDDHKPPQSIVNFRSETDMPLDLGLLIDTSGSVRTRFDFEQESAVDFLQQTLRPHFDRAFVMGFNSHTTITQDFTDDNVLLRIGVHRLQNGGGTALYDAIYRACRTKLLKDDEDRPARRAIIVVSDGEDNQSDVTEGQAIEMAQRAQVIIYAISTDDSGLILRGDTVLQQLADATGGRAFFPFKMKDIKSSFSAIEDELRSQYVISYHPADFEANGRYRPIEITALKKDLQVRARKGYYAPTQ
ncbi:MAG TPA: VWA domain-containing protein [Terriglobales bacterium]|nr:VWA domain-containing protein [Terriglobales bacterium]